MLLSFLALLAALGFVYHVMNADERARAIRVIVNFLEGEPRRDPFLVSLRERTRWTLVTPAFVALNTAIFLLMLFDPATSGQSDTLIGWGGNYGPRTTNGEWWRLVKAMFVHAGLLHLVANVAGLFQLGLVVERLIGPLAFAAVYVAAGTFANLAALSQDPLGLSVGASGAVFGIYGVLVSASVWAALEDSSLRISLITLKRLVPAAAIFILYNFAADNLSFTAELAGLVTGLAGGAVLARDIGEERAPLRRTAATAAAALVIAAVAAIPLRGVDDVRPDLQRVIDVEERTASAYETALQRFRKGRMSAESLALLIEKTIVPDLQAASAHLKTLDMVPAEYQPLVSSAEDYLRLRHASWLLRAEGLRKMEQIRTHDSRRGQTATLPETVMLTLKQADRTERDSLNALQKIKPAPATAEP